MCNQNRLTWVCWWSRRSQVTTLTEPTQILEQSGNKAEEPGWNGPLGAWVCKVSTPKCRCYCHERVRSQNEQINVCFRKNRNPQKKTLEGGEIRCSQQQLPKWTLHTELFQRICYWYKSHWETWTRNGSSWCDLQMWGWNAWSVTIF